MFKMEMHFEGKTGDVHISMPVIALLNMAGVITDNIRPDELHNKDSIGEAVLAEFVRRLFLLNDELLKVSQACDVEEAIDEANEIITDAKKGN